ncbi:MAG: hypothetical protein WA484_06575 [Solirubrobacteraceae bacterium]
MSAVTTRETAHALLERVPDDGLDEIVAFLSCRRAANGKDLSAKAIRERAGLLDPTPEQAQAFWREHGPHMQPPDGEG